MASGSSANLREVQNVRNSLLQQTNQTSSALCKQVSRDSVVVIDNVTAAGNVDLTAIVQSCQQSITSTLDATLDGQVQNILQAMAKSTQDDISSPISFTVKVQDTAETIKQRLSSQISQISSASCSYDTTQTSENNIAVISNVSAGGNAKIVGLDQSSNQQSVCFIDTSSKAFLYNKLKADEVSKQKIESIFALLIILGIVIVIVLGLVATVFVYNMTKTDSSGNSQFSKLVESQSSGAAGGSSKKGIMGGLEKEVAANPELLAL